MVSTLVRPPSAGRAARRWLRAWWHIVHLGALIVAVALTPSPWRRPWRTAIAARVWRGSAPVLPWFGVLSTLISLVIMRIVLVTAQSYGLSQYALEMMVRVLVLELIPLTTALFVAMRVSLPAAVELAQWRERGQLAAARREGVDVMRQEIVPRAVASLFAVLLLAALAGVVCLVLAYVLVHGFTPWGLDRYTRVVGRIFTPVVSLIFVAKTLGFAAAVSLIPIGSALHDRSDERVPSSLELQGLVRMFAAILLIECVSLAGNYI